MRLLIIVCSIVLLSACGSNVQEKFNKLPDRQWDYKQPQQFIFHLDEGIYSVQLDLQNTNDYPFENIWLSTSIKGPDGETVSGRNSYSLAWPDGEWKGNGPGAYYDLPIVIGDDFRVQKSGDYTFTLAQNMRTDKLQGISGVGIRLRKNVAGYFFN
jgi:gliding motility-associated lipoprotein GldH